MFCNWDIEIKLIKAKLTGENACKLILIICAQMLTIIESGEQIQEAR